MCTITTIKEKQTEITFYYYSLIKKNTIFTVRKPTRHFHFIGLVGRIIRNGISFIILQMVNIHFEQVENKPVVYIHQCMNILFKLVNTLENVLSDLLLTR